MTDTEQKAMDESAIDLAKMARTLSLIVDLLSTGGYEELERMTNGVRLSADTIRREIERWPVPIVPPPSIDMLINAMNSRGGGGRGPIYVPHQGSPVWALDVPLYSVEEGASDLEIRLWLMERIGATYHFEINDILVP